MNEATRYCHSCDQHRPLSAFGATVWHCKSCDAADTRRWREANQEWIAEYNRRRREDYAANLEPLERRCEICTKSYTPIRRDSKTCSRECRSKLSYLYRKARQLEASASRALSG